MLRSSIARFLRTSAGLVDTDTLMANATGIVVHGATAGTSRPTIFDVVIWIGSVEPTNAANDDLWIDNS